MTQPVPQHELTAFHEAGHAIAVERFNGPLCVFYYRLICIELWYDKQYRRFDGRAGAHVGNLTPEQDLFRTVAGYVAQIMRETVGDWSARQIQQRVRGPEIVGTHDQSHWNEVLDILVSPDNRDQQLHDAVEEVFLFLREHWELVRVIAYELLGRYDPDKREASINRDELSRQALDGLANLAV